MERVVTVVPENGLHARPAAEFVRTAGEYESDVTIEPTDERKPPARADSMLAVTGLGVTGGEEVRLSGDGPDAEAALDALEAVLSRPVADDD